MKYKLKRLKRKFRYNRKRSYFSIFLLFLVFSIGLGYAALSTTLSIDGSAQFKDARWNVYFNNLNVTSGSVTATTAASITNTTTVSFAARLENPNDFYEFTVDVVNGGNMNAMIESFNILPELTTAQQNYLSYTVTYSDGIELAQYQKLDAGDTETLKVRFEYLENSDASLYPTDDDNLTIAFDVTYVQADENAINKPVRSFADDSWELVINTLKTGDIEPYAIGDEREIDLGSFGVHRLRIANSTSPSECSTTGFSQTACGIVLEFVDVITTAKMNSTKTSSGGWRDSEMRTYLNNDILNEFPAIVKNAIIDTTVVSGATSTGVYFTSVDKLYFLSTHEVLVDVTGSAGSNIDVNDVAYDKTRQLDYYALMNNNTSSYAASKKYGNNAPIQWWLRSGWLNANGTFFVINLNGNSDSCSANVGRYISPAFRIA